MDSAGENIVYFPPDFVDPTPAANADGALYPVAGFHTHTPEEFAPITFPGRATGPLGEDIPNANLLGMPGFVYDYIADLVFAGDAETNSAKIYPYGPEKRELRK